MNCDWVRANIPLYIYDELGDDGRHELDQHTARCPNCAQELSLARQFHQAMLALPLPEPSPNLLAASRMRLQEALETAEQSRNWMRFFDPGSWLRQVRFAPALAAAIFIVGFAGGIGTAYRMAAGAQRFSAIPSSSQPTESAISGIRSINSDPGSNKVEIKFDKVTSEATQGSIDDPRIQQLLFYAARNQYNPGVRMDSIGLLTRNPEDAHVREALIFALRYDTNPGVRLKALDGLGPYVRQDIRVRDAVLEVLINDSNSGVRAEAMNLLGPVKADASVRTALRQLAEHDQNKYIRSQARYVLASVSEMN